MSDINVFSKYGVKVVLPGVVWRCEHDDDLGFDLIGQAQGQWPNLVNIERRQRISGLWIEKVAPGVTFRCESNADLGFYPRGQGQGQRPNMAKISIFNELYVHDQKRLYQG